jgi:hypothetical protein
MEGLCGMMCWEIWGSVQLVKEQVRAHSSNRVDAILFPFLSESGRAC